MQKKYCKIKKNSSGLTLVEVLASLFIMSLLIMGALKAKASISKQIYYTNQREKAIELCDQMLTRYVVDGDLIQSGVSEDESIRWALKYREVEVLDKTQAQVLSLVFSNSKDGYTLFEIEILNALNIKRGD